VAEPGGRMGLVPPLFFRMGLGSPLFNLEFASTSLSSTISIGSVVKVNRKIILQNFGSILAILFAIWQDS